MTVDGRHCRYYIAGPRGSADRFWMAVTYHGPDRRGNRRQLSVSPRLLARMLTPHTERTA